MISKPNYPLFNPIDAMVSTKNQNKNMIPYPYTFTEKEINEIRLEKRLLKVIKSYKGTAWFKEFITILSDSGCCYRFTLESKPIGKYYNEDEYDHYNIPGYWVNQTTNGGYTGDEFAGTISIKLKENKYLQFYYSM